MSVRSEWACDLCGQDCHIDAIRAFYGASCVRVDVGPCCYSRPITDLIEQFAKTGHVVKGSHVISAQ